VAGGHFGNRELGVGHDWKETRQTKGKALSEENEKNHTCSPFKTGFRG